MAEKKRDKAARRLRTTVPHEELDVRIPVVVRPAGTNLDEGDRKAVEAAGAAA